MSRTIIDVLSDYFHIGDSYHYVLGRDKAAFGIGTMSTDDFKEYDTDDVAEIAAHLEAVGVSIQQWISVSERLPEEFVSVLVCIPSENPLPTVKEAYLANGAWATKMAIFFMEEVTHWMPMPEPPKEK